MDEPKPEQIPPIKLSRPVTCDHCKVQSDTLYWLDAGGWLVCGACAHKWVPVKFSLSTKCPTMPAGPVQPG